METRIGVEFFLYMVRKTWGILVDDTYFENPKKLKLWGDVLEPETVFVVRWGQMLRPRTCTLGHPWIDCCAVYTFETGDAIVFCKIMHKAVARLQAMTQEGCVSVQTTQDMHACVQLAPRSTPQEPA